MLSLITVLQLLYTRYLTVSHVLEVQLELSADLKGKCQDYFGVCQFKMSLKQVENFLWEEFKTFQEA